MQKPITQTLVAGCDDNGFQDGPGRKALFSGITAACEDPDRNIVMVEASRHRVRLFDVKTGRVSTIAGIGLYGTADGSCQIARFHSPRAVCCAPDGTIIVADFGSFRIRSIDCKTKIVSTLAGSHEGVEDDVGERAEFLHPNALVCHGGSVYVADAHAIRAISLATRAVTTVAGRARIRDYRDGPGTNARFSAPSGLAVDLQGQNLLVCDQGNECIRVVSLTDGQYTASTITINGPNPSLFYRINSPDSLCVDGSGRLIVSTVKAGVQVLDPRTGGVTAVEGLDVSAVLTCAGDGALYGIANSGSKLIRIDGLAVPPRPTREQITEFGAEVLSPVLPHLLPLPVVSIIAAYTLPNV